ncbi:Uncharacterized conserved protein, DUF58 family, contains vWF domain [Oceanobacillus limi]|uniref:Uncharacterized conserved protein, DUF58 family, contains vWF domain n=1 Tax=Oceanobacillus limi TaxID=930131 RepID=A0A1I0DST8_9BACI|nr:DUF58 domain-containing protein [Oceanobacillus limi]SET35364.1 Uncharacterized conserved protein, DUF58 family, contains vWF domain [Oceanobacillus limi]
MMWKKEVGLEHSKSFDYVLIALVLFFLIGVIFRAPIAFVGVGIFLSYLIVYKVYDRGIGQKLELESKEQSIKLFPGEEANLKFELRNYSLFPIVNGMFKVQIGPSVKAYTLVDEQEEYWKQLKLPLSVLQKRNTTIEFPVIAEQRGVSKVNNIEYTFPHLLNFNLVTLGYRKFFRTEFIVYPKLLPVEGAEAIFHMIPGDGRANFSPFEDIQSPRGTRDYSFSDPFHRINWNASVKSQSLQTNIYERVVDMSYVFIVNLSTEKGPNKYRYNKNLENLLSYTAYLSEFATKTGVPYEIYVNARKPGKIPYIQLPEGEGKSHYGHALEMLARVHKQSMIMPFNQLLHRLGKQFINPKTIIIIGEVPTGALETIQTWKQVQNTVFQVTGTEEGAVVRPIRKETYTNAT